MTDVVMAGQRADLRTGQMVSQMAGYWVVPMAEKKAD